MDQGGRALAAIGPEVDIDHQRPHGIQGRDQVLAQKGGLADAADAGQEHPGSHLQLQRTGLQQLPGHVLGVLVAVKDVGTGHV